MVAEIKTQQQLEKGAEGQEEDERAPFKQALAFLDKYFAQLAIDDPKEFAEIQALRAKLWMEKLKPEERLVGLKPEERLVGLKPEERQRLRELLDQDNPNQE